MDGASNGNTAAQQLMLLSASLAKSAEADSATGASASSEGEKKRKRTGSHAPSPGKTKKKKMEKDTSISAQAMLAAATAMLPGAALLLEKQPSLDPSAAIKAAAVITAAHATNISSLLRSGKKSDEERQKIKQKKATHNATEKRRQARISMQFTELKNVIESASGQTIRRGRGQILAAALLFMSAILQENLTLRNSMNQLLAHQQMSQGGSANHTRTPQFTPPMTSQHMLQYHHMPRQPRQPQVHLSAQPPMGPYSQMSTSRSTSTEGTKRL